MASSSTAMTGDVCFAVASLSALDYAYRSLLEKRPWPSGTPLPAAILIFLAFLLFRLWVLALVMGYPHIVRRYDFHKFIFGGSSCPTHRLRRNSRTTLLCFCSAFQQRFLVFSGLGSRQEFCCSFVDDHVVNFLPRNTAIKLPFCVALVIPSSISSLDCFYMLENWF